MMGATESKYVSPEGSYVVPGTGDATHTVTRRTADPRYREGLVPTAFAEVKTQYACFQRGLRTNPDGPCMGHRPLTGETKKETDDKGREKVRGGPCDADSGRGKGPAPGGGGPRQDQPSPRLTTRPPRSPPPALHSPRRP